MTPFLRLFLCLAIVSASQIHNLQAKILAEDIVVSKKFEYDENVVLAEQTAKTEGSLGFDLGNWIAIIENPIPAGYAVRSIQLRLAGAFTPSPGGAFFAQLWKQLNSGPNAGEFVKQAEIDITHVVDQDPAVVGLHIHTAVNWRTDPNSQPSGTFYLGFENYGLIRPYGFAGCGTVCPTIILNRQQSRVSSFVALDEMIIPGGRDYMTGVTVCNNGQGVCNNDPTMQCSASCNACPTGFSGAACNDINECAQLTTCSTLVTCTNTPGSFYCGPCPTGYTGTGCSNINECTSNLHDCDINAMCTDTQGSFTCACSSGFTGTGIAGGCACIPNPVSGTCSGSGGFA